MKTKSEEFIKKKKASSLKKKVVDKPTRIT